jgi:hypothetical protein
MGFFKINTYETTAHMSNFWAGNRVEIGKKAKY